MKVKAKNVPRRECDMELNGCGLTLLDMKTKQYGVTFSARAPVPHDINGRTLDLVLTAAEMEEVIVAYEKVKRYNAGDFSDLHRSPSMPKYEAPCDWCHGRGKVTSDYHVTVTCPRCLGTGRRVPPTSTAYQQAYAEVAGGKCVVEDDRVGGSIYSLGEVKAIARKHGLSEDETTRLLVASNGPMGSPS